MVLHITIAKSYGKSTNYDFVKYAITQQKYDGTVSLHDKGFGNFLNLCYQLLPHV